MSLVCWRRRKRHGSDTVREHDVHGEPGLRPGLLWWRTDARWRTLHTPATQVLRHPEQVWRHSHMRLPRGSELDLSDVRRREGRPGDMRSVRVISLG